MISESTLTNVLTVSGVSTVKYRIYTEPHDIHDKPHYVSDVDAITGLHLTALKARIPAIWHSPHVAPTFQDSEEISTHPRLRILQEADNFAFNAPDPNTTGHHRELWVFFMDDAHSKRWQTETIERQSQNLHLHYQGTFTWDALFQSQSALSSAVAPPVTTSTTQTQANVSAIQDGHQSSNKSRLLVVYRLFLAAVRLLVENLLVAKGAHVLGGRILFPQISNDALQPGANNLDASTIPGCQLRTYLSATNFVIQAQVSRYRIRSLSLSDLDAFNAPMRVILSPSGTFATIASSSKPGISPQQESAVLEEWYRLLAVSPPKGQRWLDPRGNMPSLLLVVMPDGRTVLYPSNLIFVESDAKASSAQLCGLKGVHSRNHGLIESLGDKVDRGAWAERVQSASELADSIQLAKRPSNSKSKATVSAYKKLKTESEVQTTPNEIMPKTLEVHEINYRNYTDTIIHETASALDLTHLEGTSPSTAATHIKEVKTERNTASPMPLEEDVAWWESRLPSTDINAYDVSWHAQRDSSEATHNGSITPTTPLVSLQQTSGIPTGATDATTPIPISVKPLPPEDNRVSLAQPSGEDASAPVTRYPSPSSSGLLGHGDSDVQFRLDDMDGLDGMNGVMFGDMNTGSAWGTNDYSDLENLGSMHVTEDDFSFFDDTPKPSQLMATNTMGRQFDQNSLLASGVHSRDSFAMDDKGLGDGLDSIDIDAMFDGPELTEMNKSESVGAPTVISEDIPSLTNTTNTVTSITEADEFDEQLSPQLNRPIVHVHSGNISVSISAEVDNIKCLAPCLPADYAPMRIMTGVNDAKYGYGGKFTLPMPKSMQRKVRSRIGYRPDYMPVTPFAVLQIKSQRKESLPTASLDYTQVHSEGRFAELSSATEVSESDSGDYSVSDQEPESNDIEEDINQANEAARSAYLHLMQRYSGSEEPEHRTQQSRIAQEFDTPFVDCVASTDAFSKTRQKSEFEGDLYLRSLDILCEQAVLGGYPFSGGLADINTRGGEVVDGDFPHTFGARWFSMLNTTTNSPSKIRTVDEEQGLILAEVKEVLASTFDPNFIAPEVWANSFGEDDTTRHTVPASVSIKGPLTLQQYCDLTEANPTQSKYGKWQVKKKRPVEPSIYALDTPEVVVGLKDDWLVTSPHILRFWEKARLEPYSAKKGVVYFVVCPQNPVLEASVTNFLTELSAIYDACSLGIHQPGTAGEFKSGLVPVALLPEIDGEAQEDRELRSYMAACQKLGATLGPMLTDKFHVVVYMLNPFRHKSAYLDLSHCFAKLLHAYDIASMAATARLGNKIRQRVVLQFLPVEHVLRSSAFGGYLKFGLEDIAFSVYNKCSRTLERSEGRVRFEQNKEVAEFYSPAYVLARSKQPSVLFKLKGALRDFPVVTSDQTFLHLAYTWSADKRWLLAVWTDGCGELTDFATYTLDSVDSDETSDPWEFVRDVFASLWRKSLLFSKRAGLSWRFVIGKLGSMFEAELQQWIKVIPVEQHVDIVALEPDAMLQFSPNMDLSSSEFIPSTPASGGAVTPDALGLPGASPQPSKMEAVQKRNDDIIALLLNHRATVSSRDTFYLGPQGVTPPEHSASEILMVPLATGYMVRLPTKQTSQVRNLACTSPFTIELHLLYTKLNHPPQSVLRTIIKQYHALSYLNAHPMPNHILPIHYIRLDRLHRLLMNV